VQGLLLCAKHFFVEAMIEKTAAFHDLRENENKESGLTSAR